LNASQVAHIESAIERLDLNPSVLRIVRVAPQRRAGFLALRTMEAGSVVSALRRRDVFVDARGDVLRMGPAPYVSETQLEAAVAELAAVLAGNPRV
jgi:kynureninase